MAGSKMDLRRFLSVLVLVAASFRLAAAACDVNYSGPANGLWQTPGNWDTNLAPTSGQAVCIPAGKGTIMIGAGVAAAAKDITAASGLAIAATGSLAISDTTTVGFPNSVTDLSIASGGTLSSAGSAVSIAGQAVVDGLLSGKVQLASGALSGTGTIAGAFGNAGGTVRPGGAATIGALSFGGLFTQGVAGTLEIELASDVSFDKINGPSQNNVLIDGTIVVTLLGGYTPADGTTWAFVPPNTFGSSISGHVTPSTFTAHSIPFGAELVFHPSANTTTTTAAPTTTTTAGATTTTTAGTPPTSTSTSTTTTSNAPTTLLPVSTTTTMPPAGCAGPSAPTFVSIDCRLDALIAQLASTPDVPAKLKAGLMKSLQKARTNKQQAERAPTVTRAVLAELKQARRRMINFSHRIRSRNGRRAIHGDTGTLLAAAGDDISQDLKTLRESVRSGR